MTGRSPEGEAFLRLMLTISPTRAAILKNLEAIDAATEEAVRTGTPVFCADATHALSHAAIEQLASMAEKNIPASSIIAALEIGFANALANTLKIIAFGYGMDTARFADDQIQRIHRRVQNSIARSGGPNPGPRR